MDNWYFENILKHLIEEVDASPEDKHQFFIQRTNQHIDLVKRACDKLMKEFPEFKELKQRGIDHDKSKFEEPELTPYIELTWAKKLEATDNRKFDPSPEVLAATLHHITHNSHHPEFHVKDKTELEKKREKAVDATAMPDIDIAEMVADWQAMSDELGKNTAREWFNKNKDVKWHFDDKQIELIDKLLAVFEGAEKKEKPAEEPKEEPKPETKPETENQ